MKPRADTDPIPTHWSGPKLAGWLDINDNTVRTLLGPLNIANGKGYDILKAIPALIAHYRGMAEKSSRLSAESHARQKEADATRSEVALQREIGNLIDKGEAEALWRAVVIGIREKVRLMDAPLELKQAFCALLAEAVPQAKEAA
jgi:hypothetical protein